MRLSCIGGRAIHTATPPTNFPGASFSQNCRLTAPESISLYDRPAYQAVLSEIETLSTSDNPHDGISGRYTQSLRALSLAELQCNLNHKLGRTRAEFTLALHCSMHSVPVTKNKMLLEMQQNCASTILAWWDELQTWFRNLQDSGRQEIVRKCN